MTNIDPAIAEAVREHVEHMRGYTLPALSPGFMDGYYHALKLMERDAGFIASKANPPLSAAVDAARAEGDKQGAARVREAVEAVLSRIENSTAIPIGWEAATRSTVSIRDVRKALTEAAPK